MASSWSDSRAVWTVKSESLSSASLFFKAFKSIAPLMQKSGLVYTVVSTKLIAGSPFNSINVVLPGCDKPVLAQDRR